MSGNSSNSSHLDAPVARVTPKTPLSLTRPTPRQSSKSAGNQAPPKARKSVGGKAPRIPNRSVGDKTPRFNLLEEPEESEDSATTSSSPCIAASWYQNPKFSDITIKYGPEAASTFTGHRLILCNSSQWFQLSSNAEFAEADARIITIKDDHPAAINALFKYCYLGNHTEKEEGDDTEPQWINNLFLQHARVLVAADKYMAEGLVELAERKLRRLLGIELAQGEHKASLFNLAVEQLYLHPDVFGLAVGAVDETQQDEELEDEAEDEDDPNEGGFSTSEVSALTSIPAPQHPLDRLKRLVVDAAVKVWAHGDDDLDRKHLAILVRQIPKFGNDLVLSALASSSLT